MKLFLASLLLIPLMCKAGHWSLEPVRRPALGKTHQAANAVDVFVLAKLNAANLAPSRLAKRSVLIRRLYLVMLGTHPSSEDVKEFVKDLRPDAWDRLVDRVLNDPRLGERWAKYPRHIRAGRSAHGGQRSHARRLRRGHELSRHSYKKLLKITSQ